MIVRGGRSEGGKGVGETRIDVTVVGGSDLIDMQQGGMRVQ